MEYLQTYYSLEKHLEETIKVNPQFEVLNAIWKLNKKSLSSALSNVSQYYPHYSLHEKSHSNTIISNIESFLGEERIKRLSPTDTWLLLMASFTHDLGMVVFHELIESEWGSTNFQNFLQEISEWDDADMNTGGKLLLKIQHLSKNYKDEDTTWLTELAPIKIKNAVTLAVSEYMRRIHHKRSSDILKGIDQAFFQVANSFYSDQIPSRLLTVLAEVAYLHGVEFYDIFSRLDHQSNGIANDKIHPRFIATMLRLGDLLDIDDSRFNVFTEKVFQFPETSKGHKRKHSSVKHFLITPESIEITSDCPDENSYRLARSWYDWLEGEVQNQGREWSNIAPHNLGGSAPRISKGKIKVYYNGTSVDSNLLNLRFKISNEKIFQILEGASIYEKAEFTFIRELVQNALDASKIQMWKEIESGTYDFVFRNHFEKDNLSHEEIINSIVFPSDIPSSLTESYSVLIEFDWKDSSREELTIIIEDSGTGISDESLLRMTAKVGESRSKDDSYNKMLERMPFWLKPTGAFGIGLQSVFIVVDSFKIQTKSEGEHSKEIIFRSAKKGKYSSLSGNRPDIKRGTKVIINISKDKFPQAFGTTFTFSSLDGYDYFTDSDKSVYIPKIKDYINRNLSSTPNLNIRYFGNRQKNYYSYYTEKNSLINTTTNENIEFKLNKLNERIIFEYSENIIGSKFTLNFDFWSNNNFTHCRNDYYVRDILIKENSEQFYALQLPKFIWNLMSPKSDKILNISRDKFLQNKLQKLESTFVLRILPTALRLALKQMEFNKEKIIDIYSSKPTDLAYLYFKLYFTCIINKLDVTPPSLLFLNREEIALNIVSTLEDIPLKMIDFFEVTHFILPRFFIRDGKTDQLVGKKNLVEESSRICSNNFYISWDDRFLEEYFKSHFYMYKIFYFDTGEVKYFTKISSSQKELEVNNICIYLKNFIPNQSNNERTWNYAANRYSRNIFVKGVYPTGFERFPTYNDQFIISPFNTSHSFDKFKRTILRGNSSLDRDQITMLVTDEAVLEYIVPSMIEWIIENNADDKKVTKQEIIDGYRELLIDILYFVDQPTSKSTS